MFFTERNKLLEAIRIMQRENCVYDLFGKTTRGKDVPVAYRCDCKYGYLGKPSSASSEVTGCPELRSVCALLANITDEEYEQILTRRHNLK